VKNHRVDQPDFGRKNTQRWAARTHIYLEYSKIISIAGLCKLQPSIPAVNNELAINNGSINPLDSELERYGDPSG
ncbi:hypothetical protein BB560_006403, partial [Smittium megazygosporum]